MKMETNKKAGWDSNTTPDKIDFKTKAIQETKKDPVMPLLGIYPKKPQILL